MTYPSTVVDQAVSLRSDGHSYQEIAGTVGASKSIVRYWVKDTSVSAEGRKRLKARYSRGVQKGGEAKKLSASKNRKLWRERGKVEASGDQTLLLVAALYWAEGSKNGRGWRFCNSDPDMIRVVANWLARSKWSDKVKVRIHYHVGNGLSANAVKRWWLGKVESLGGVPFYTPHKMTPGKKVGKLPYGVLHLRVDSVDLFEFMMGAIDTLK